MSIGTAIGELEALFLEGIGEILRVLHDLPLQLLELRGPGQGEGGGDGGELVHVWASLSPGEDRELYQLGDVGIGGHDHRPPGATQGLVGGEHNDVSVADGVGIDPGDGHPRGVGDVGHEIRPHLIGDLPERRPVGRPGVGGVAGDDHPGPVFHRQVHDVVVVQPFRPGVDAVGDDPEAAPRLVEGGTVGEVATL